ncbi:MAG: hypothetical protein CVT59_06705 [Actinobacteria bacterium HGW-Actinobacteria-1]|jgi:hypothetical protein|nr:MAG: hypothetical protein CVT59_06705 [Actinobacteria bacterium HGW-Actinobacteria-1]
MGVLTSRNYASSELFVADFLASLTPGVIPRGAFINWDKMDARGGPEARSLAFFERVQSEFRLGAELQDLLTQRLLESGPHDSHIRFAFNLLGHTAKAYISRDDCLNIAELDAGVRAGDEAAARLAAEALCGIGLDHLLALSSLRSCMVGVRVGLETHRRKNVGGTEFSSLVARELHGIAERLGEASGRSVVLRNEDNILYGDDLHKRVDYAIYVDGLPRFGFEVNFYTSSGSKPSEIKRSYGEVARGLHSVGVDLIWITDGAGYHSMKKSLRDAYVILPNTYNLRQLKHQLELDLSLELAEPGQG